MLQQLGGTDASFLYMETAETPMHVGSLYLYELPPGYTGDFYEDFKAQIAHRMHLFPILTRKLAQLPFDLDAPLWVEDDAIDLDYHIRRHTVPKPGRFDQIEELVGRLHSNFLDRSRPLWEIYIIDGLGDGRVAEYAKFHHAGFDGVAAMAFIQSLYDTTPVPREVPPPRPHGKKEELDPIKLMGLVYSNALRQYVRAIQAIPDFLKAWAKLSVIDPDTLRLEPPELPHLAPRTPLNVAITSQRSYAARTVSLKDIKQIAKSNGATVNDAVMAMCSGALRRYLSEKHDLPSESLTAFVPVSLREAGNTQMNNQVFGMICGLATNVIDPIKRLLAIHDSSQNAKRFTDTIKSAALSFLSPWGTPFLVHGLMDLLGHHHVADQTRPLANLTISNNIGPSPPLYLAGAKLLSVYPMSIPTHGSALNITVQSYGDNLDVGLTACRHALPDVRKLADYIVDALDDLKTAALRQATQDATVPADTATRSPHRAAKRRSAANAKRATHAPRAVKRMRDNGKPKFPVMTTESSIIGNVAQPDASNTLFGAAAANVLSERSIPTASAVGKRDAPEKVAEPAT
jgi:diacylglycerol O-acyltransferase